MNNEIVALFTGLFMAAFLFYVIEFTREYLEKREKEAISKDYESEERT